MVPRKECGRTMVGPRFLCCWLLIVIHFICPIFTLNNTCYRTESYEVEIMVPVREPVTYRSYTWCLKVPPRCSKYTVQYRERLTYETEVRNRTVTECCEGFIQLYSDCIPQCSNCTNIQCNSTSRECTCLPGFVGRFCNESCEDGKWGNQCLEVCTCRVDESCDKSTGLCTPKATYSTAHPVTSVITATQTQEVKSTTNATNAGITTTAPSTSTTTFVSTSDSQTNLLTYETTPIKSSTETSIPLTVSFSNANTTLPMPSTTASLITNKTTSTHSLHQVNVISSTATPTTNITNRSSPSIILETTLKKDNDNFTPTHSLDIKTTEFVSPISQRDVSNVQTQTTKLPFTQYKENVFSINPKINILKHWPSTIQPESVAPIKFTMPEYLGTTTLPELPSSNNEKFPTTVIMPETNSVGVTTSGYSVNSTIIYAEWINDLSSNSSVTLAAALVLLVLVIVTTSVVVHCCNHKSQKMKSKADSPPGLPVRNSIYDVPGPPTFSFIHAYALELMTKDSLEASYDHPCSARCLINEPVYDELRY